MADDQGATGITGAPTELEVPEVEVVEIPDVEDAVRQLEPLPDALPILPLRETVTYPETLTPLVAQPTTDRRRNVGIVDGFGP